MAVALILSSCSWVGLGGSDEPRPAPNAQQSTEATASQNPGAFPLQPGDQIRVSSWREEGISDVFVVDEEGTVVLPLLGARKVEGIPANELRSQLVEDYESRFRNHTVGVTLLRRVSILGAVREPGVYHVDPTMTVSEAVALAGGPDTGGKRGEATIIRDGEEIQRELGERTQLRSNVRSGDQIIVPQQSWFVRNATFIIGTSISTAAVLLTRGW